MRRSPPRICRNDRERAVRAPRLGTGVLGHGRRDRSGAKVQWAGTRDLSDRELSSADARNPARRPVITTAQAQALWQSHAAAFIDVLPRPPRPANLPAGTIWHEKPRNDIPGSV